MESFDCNFLRSGQQSRKQRVYMKTFISMLRGINVSGQKKIKMIDLRTLYESLGFVNVETYVQSGNVVFGCDENSIRGVAEMIESRIEQFFGYSVSVFIRDRVDFQRIIGSNPFIHKQKVDQSAYHLPVQSPL